MAKGFHGMPNMGGNMGQLLQQAQKMQHDVERVQEEIKRQNPPSYFQLCGRRLLCTALCNRVLVLHTYVFIFI